MTDRLAEMVNALADLGTTGVVQSERRDAVRRVLAEFGAIVPDANDLAWTAQDAGDPELTSIRALLELLGRIPDDHRDRVLRYVLERFDMEHVHAS